MNKTKKIDIKVTEEQFAVLNKKASALNLNLSEFMIFCGMNAQISVSVGGFSAFTNLNYEMNLIVKMKERGDITQDEFDRLKAALVEKYSKTDGH